MHSSRRDPKERRPCTHFKGPHYFGKRRKANADFRVLMARLKSRPFKTVTRMLTGANFSAGCKPLSHFDLVATRLKRCSFKEQPSLEFLFKLQKSCAWGGGV
jgi:hypothetical protein